MKIKITHCSLGNVVQGFSLIELIMVLVLMSILSAQILPRFFDLGTYQEKVLFDDTLNALRFAQKLAVANNCRVQVAFSGNQFALKRPVSRTYCSSATAVDFTSSVSQPGTGSAYVGSLSGISISASPAIVYFDALGKASANVSVSVGSRHSLVVVQDTGFVYDTSP